MFICSELIEETGRLPGLIFGIWGYFWPGSDKFEDLYDRKMVTNTNLKFADSSSNYYVIIIVQKFLKIFSYHKDPYRIKFSRFYLLWSVRYQHLCDFSHFQKCDNYVITPSNV